MDGYSTRSEMRGGFSPDISSNEKAICYIVKAISEAGYQPGKDVTLALMRRPASFGSMGSTGLRIKKIWK